MATKGLKDSVKIHHPVLTVNYFGHSGVGEIWRQWFAGIALGNLCQRFKTLPEKAGLPVTAIEDEWKDILEYAKLYLNIVPESYRIIYSMHPLPVNG